MKLITVFAVFMLSTGLAWGAAVEPEKETPSSPTVQETEKKAPSPAQLAQREKMKLCNAEASKNELKGNERRKFMSQCLKADK